MQITLKQSNLKKALSKIKRVVPSNPQLPILNAVLIKAEQGSIIISATDLFTGIETKVLGSVTEEGQVAIPARALSDIIATAPSGNITLETKEDSINIITDKSNSSLQVYASDEYPQFPEKQGDVISLSTQVFEDIVTYVVPATAKDDSRPILTAALFNLGEKLEVVATDGFRLATLDINHSSTPQKLLIPAKSLSEIMKLYDETESDTVELTVSTQLKQIFCTFGDTQMVIRLMEGEYPPYEKIIPQNFETQVTFDSEEFLRSIKSALIFARESSNIVRFVLSGSEMTILASSPTLGNHQSKILIEPAIADEKKIAFNAQYLVDFLSSIKTNKVWFGMNESLQPALLRPEGMEAYRYIVMPFRVNE